MRHSFPKAGLIVGRPPGRCELIEAVRAANGSRKKLRVCRPYKQSVGPRDTLHIPGICAPFSESRLVHIFPGVCPTISLQFPALGKLTVYGWRRNKDSFFNSCSKRTMSSFFLLHP